MNFLKKLKQLFYNPLRNKKKKFEEWVYHRIYIKKGKSINYSDLSEGAVKNTKKLLYVGSGKSALEYKNHSLDGVDILAVNNSYRAFDCTIDYYLCSNDFPKNRRPQETQYKNILRKPDFFYGVLSHAKLFQLSFRPQVGKTIFLDGLYWAMAKGYSEIYLLGFDHDYNPERVKKWQGKYINDQEKLKKMFDGIEGDSFYGQNTPDPLRHGENNLKSMFENANKHAIEYQSTIFNLSSKISNFNVFKRASEINSK